MAHAMHCFCCASRRFVHGTHDFVLTWSSGPLSNSYALFLLRFMLAHMHLARNGRLACCQAAIHWFLLRVTPDSESGVNPGFCISHMHLAWDGRLALPSNGHTLFLLRIMSDRAWCIWPEMASQAAIHSFHCALCRLVHNAPAFGLGWPSGTLSSDHTLS